MELKCFIHAQWSKYSEKFSYSVHNCDMTDYGYILLEEIDVPFESPNYKQLQVLTVKALRALKTTKLAAAQKECLEIQQEIDELLAIEYKPDESII